MRRALRLRESQVERDPKDQRAAVEMANRLAQVAATIAAGAPQESILLFQRSAHIYGKLPAPVRQSGYSRQFEWFTHCSMAEPLAKLGRRGDAAAAIREGLAIAEPDAREGNFERRLDLLTCRYQAARARRVLGRSPPSSNSRRWRPV